MSKASRDKGARGERECLGLLSELIGTDLARNLAQTRDAGADNIETDWALEIKRQETARPAEWWRQAVEQAEAAGKIPALAYRGNRQAWRVRVALADISDFYVEPREVRWTADITLEAFAALVREQMEAA
jgi:hypothetical protein